MKPGDLVIVKPAFPNGRTYTSTGWIDGTAVGLVLEGPLKGVIHNAKLLVNGEITSIDSTYLRVIDEAG